MYGQDVLALESLVKRIVSEGEVDQMTYPKVFDCPVCKHQTLSDTRSIKTEDGKKSARYCFGCGKTFFKEVSWTKVKEGKDNV